MEGFFSSSLGIAALVVVALVIIYFAMSKSKSIVPEEDNIHQKQVAVSKITSANEEQNDKQDDLELVAAIMGALSAYIGMPASKLKIRSIKRIDGTNSIWRREGIEEVLRED